MLLNILKFIFGPYLYWYTLRRPDRIENYGDLIGPYIFKKISGRTPKNFSLIKSYKVKKFMPHYVTIGSIISQVKVSSIVWGSGIMKKNQNVNNCNFLAVRGPYTRNRLLKLGYSCPEIYGDPALLMPLFFKRSGEIKYQFGIVPHYVDFPVVFEMFKNRSDIKVINVLTDNVEYTTREILECNFIASTSLHGLIVSNAYSIPSLWFKISDKLAGDNVKFLDYFSSVGIVEYQPFTLKDLENIDSIDTSNYRKIEDMKLKQIQKELLNVCPFK